VSQGFSEYVYSGETLIMATLTPPDTIAANSVKIGFTGDWLMCEAVCIPGGVTGTLEVPVRNAPAVKSDNWSHLFQQTDVLLPQLNHPYALAAWAEGGSVVLQVKGNNLPENAYFFDDQSVVKPEEAATAVSRTDDALILQLTPAGDVPEKLSGVLFAKSGWPGLDGKSGIAIDLPLTAKPEAQAPPQPISWASILGLAFIGGMILNLMPCVFPVLGIKIMGFVNQAGESRAKVVGHGLVFTAGVLLSFWILASVLLILRSSGNQLGWGFQLQSPGFVLALAMVLFAFGLNMSGLFEVGQSAVGVGSDLTGKSGMVGSFFSGVLATVVATPCAAPFLAPALGAALALPPLGSFAVFTFIALGLSSPYLLLSAFPAMIKWLPRPGAWMETFKQFMGFLLYATVAYLIWVLAGQLTEEGGYSVFSLLKVLISLVILAIGLWVYGRWAAYHKPRGTRYTAVGISILLAAAAIFTGLSGTGKPGQDDLAITWDYWEPGKAERLASEGRTVYVDFTARWCVTCQTNKAAVFSSKKVVDLILAEDVILLKADWTNQDPDISKELERYNRSAVPFNLVFGPATEDPLILPEILTPGTVLEAIISATGP
jgi:thiol:disulfide interchange protein DsbD